MAIKYLRTSNIKNKTVFLRVDVNEPIGEKGKVADDFRIQSVIPTIQFLRGQECKVIVCAHLGRPEGKRAQSLSLKPVAEHLAKLLALKFVETKDQVPEYPIPHVVFITGDIRKEVVQKSLKNSNSGNIIVLENIRFYPEEEANDVFFAKQLAGIADVYVNEAFSVDHHKAASLVAVTKYIPSYAGLVLEREIQSLNMVLLRPKKPFVVLMAGIKISDKAQVLKNFAKKADCILLGGGLANLFFVSRGYEVGLSKVEHEEEQLAWEMDKNFKGKLLLPLDVVVANGKMDKNTIRVCAPHEVRKNELILDIGPKTIHTYAQKIKTAKTIIWNGPLGFFEHRPFHHGTTALARIIGSVGTRKSFAVVGGGETVDAVRQAHQASYIDLLSTGGGAMLEYLAGKKLPGIEALK